MNYKWTYSCKDNGGKYQCFTVSAKSKDEAIKKGRKRAEKHAAGEIGFNWECKLQMIF